MNNKEYPGDNVVIALDGKVYIDGILQDLTIPAGAPVKVVSTGDCSIRVQDWKPPPDPPLPLAAYILIIVGGLFLFWLVFKLAFH